MEYREAEPAGAQLCAAGGLAVQDPGAHCRPGDRLMMQHCFAYKHHLVEQHLLTRAAEQSHNSTPQNKNI